MGRGRDKSLHVGQTVWLGPLSVRGWMPREEIRELQVSPGYIAIASLKLKQTKQYI